MNAVRYLQRLLLSEYLQPLGNEIAGVSRNG